MAIAKLGQNERVILLLIRSLAYENAGKICHNDTQFTWEQCVVGMTGFEPATSAFRTRRSTKLSHIPKKVEPQTGIEPVTSSLPMKCSTAELLRRKVKEYTHR